MILKLLLSFLCYVVVSSQETTTLSPEDLKLKLTFGVDFGPPIDHQIPENLTTVSLLIY